MFTQMGPMKTHGFFWSITGRRAQKTKRRTLQEEFSKSVAGWCIEPVKNY